MSDCDHSVPDMVVGPARQGYVLCASICGLLGSVSFERGAFDARMVELRQIGAKHDPDHSYILVIDHAEAC